MRRFVLVGVAALALGGCASVTEGDRQLVDQNEKAGALIETKASDPEIKQAGKDVKENSAALKKNLTGEPKEPKAYSPKASAGAREQSKKEHESTWLKTLLSVGLGLLGGGGLAGLGLKFFGGPVGTALQAVVQGIVNVRQKANGGTLTADAMLDELKKAQEAAGVQPYVAKLATKLEEKLGVKL